MCRRPAGAALAAFVMAVMTSPLAAAAGGQLDPGFGTDGKVVSDLGANAEAAAIAVQPDGRIVVGGGSTGGDLVLARFGPAGTPDPGFGHDGRTVTDLGGNDSLSDLRVQPDGKIVAVAVTWDGFRTTLLRYLPDGWLDPTFGGDGTVDLASARAPGRVLIRPSGKLVVASSLGEDRFGLARYNADGSLDHTFGSQGRAQVRVGGRAHLAASVSSAAFARDGKILVAGSRMHPDKKSSADKLPFSLVVVRYRSDGRLDRTFGNRGVATVDLRPHDSSISGLAVLRDGRIVAGGHGHSRANTPGGPAVWCFRKDGSLDRGFGTRGKVVIGNDGGLTTAVAVDGTGRIVLSGRGGPALGDFLVARLSAKGRLDRSFGQNGVATTDFGGVDTPWALTLEPDGDVLAAGGTGAELATAGLRKLAIARYLGR
jgi:uncharacterized delta-60 repeat protein